MSYEIWTSEVDLESHLAMPYLKRWVAMAPDLLTGPMELSLWRKHA
jgi:quinol monooxygenase YgiN